MPTDIAYISAFLNTPGVEGPRQMVGYVQPAYERAAGFRFDDLPRQAQAVVFSLCFQKGCNGVRRDWPRVWGYLTRRDWAGASRELLTGFRQYADRRAIEGRLLQEVA